MKKDGLLGLLRVIVSAALLALLFWLFRKNLHTVIKTLVKTNLLIFGLAISCAILSFFMMAVRLNIFLASRKVKLNIWESSYLCFVGQFFNNFLPTSVGGDIVKAYYAARKSHSKVTAFACVFMDRFIGVVSLVFLACFTAVIAGALRSKLILFLLTGIMAGTLLFLLLMWNRRLAKKLGFLLILFKYIKLDQKIKNFYDAVHQFKGERPALAKGFLLSIILQIVSYYAIYLLTISVGVPSRYIDVLLFMPIVGIAAMLPSINGLGVREGTFVYFFKHSMGAENAFAVSLLILLQNFALSLIGGILYLKGQFRIKE